MKAVVLHELGGAEVLHVEDWKKDSPKAGEVLIKVTSVGLNRADVLFHKGRYYQKPQFPSRTGKEPAGIVEEVGEGVSLKPGDRVAALPSVLDPSTQGGFAEYVCAPEKSTVPTPAGVSDEDAGGIWMQYLTAYGALNHLAKVSPGQHVVITAASSSVGIAAIQLTNQLGAIPIATTTSAGKVERLKAHGAKHVIDVKNESYVDRVQEIVDGKGVDVIFDAVTGPMMADHITVCKSFGWIFIYGVLDVAAMPVNPGILIGLNANLRGYSVRTVYENPSVLQDAVRTIGRGLDSGDLELVIDRRFPMAEIQDAQRYMESNRQCGKIIVNP